MSVSVAVAVGVGVAFAGCVNVHVHILARCARKCTNLGRARGARPPGAFGAANARCARENALLIDFTSGAAYDAQGPCFPP
jgi:hypothetical protein